MKRHDSLLTRKSFIFISPDSIISASLRSNRQPEILWKMYTHGRREVSIVASSRGEENAGIPNAQSSMSRDRLATHVDRTLIDETDGRQRPGTRRGEMENRAATLRAAPSDHKRDSPRRDERFVAGDWRLKEQPRTMQLPWP